MLSHDDIARIIERIVRRGRGWVALGDEICCINGQLC